MAFLLLLIIRHRLYCLGLSFRANSSQDVRLFHTSTFCSPAFLNFEPFQNARRNCRHVSQKTTGFPFPQGLAWDCSKDLCGLVFSPSASFYTPAGVLHAQSLLNTERFPTLFFTSAQVRCGCPQRFLCWEIVPQGADNDRVVEHKEVSRDGPQVTDIPLKGSVLILQKEFLKG